MRLSGRQPNVVFPVVLLSIALSLNACTDSHPPSITQPLAIATSESAAPSKAMGTDALFERVATKVPSFAGAYIDEKGVLVVLVTNMDDAAAATAAMRAELSGELDVNPKAPAASAERARSQPSNSRAILVAYDFSTLFKWKSLLAPGLIADDGVRTIDVD